MKTVQGDLLQLALEGRFDVIVHGCNCFHTMGAGIAKPLARLFPEALEADKATEKGNREKLGTYSKAEVRRDDVSFVVINAYTQFHWRGPGRKADYQAIEVCFAKIAREFKRERIGFPMIGAGLAGGDWTRIQKSISTNLAGVDHTLVVLPN